MIRRFFFNVGQYSIFMSRVFKRPDKFRVFYKQTIKEIDHLGINSIWIVSIMSLFMGAVLAIQTAYNIDNPFIPSYTVGFITRQSILLEFSPTIVSLLLAGKVGSRISSEIGTMRVNEQIDALDIMGINSANYLTMPKILASVLFFPILISISIILGISGGYLACMYGDVVSVNTFVMGIRSWFYPYEVAYALTKSAVFAFLITSISSFYGYTTKGGASEVGASSTQAVVSSSIAIIAFNLLISQIWLG